MYPKILCYVASCAHEACFIGQRNKFHLRMKPTCCIHLLAVAQEAGADFKMEDIDQLSRKVPLRITMAIITQI